MSPAGGGPPVPAVTGTGFVPSRHAFRFTNHFPSAPAVSIGGAGARLGIGDVADGVCGGMVFAALDYWEAGLARPALPTPPGPGSPLHRYLVRRLVDSWHLPGGPLAYLVLMHPRLPVDDVVVAGRLRVRGRRRRASEGWRAIRSVLDGGAPCPLGLVTVRSADPRRIGRNHQVLAYGYELHDGGAKLAVYDPNVGDDDTVAVDLGLDAPSAPVARLGRAGAEGAELVGVFPVRYRWKQPPAR